MSAQTIIERAQTSGLKLWAGESGALRYAGDATTFEQLRPELVANKAAILEALSLAGAVESWLSQALGSIQPAITIKVEALLLGFSSEELDAALIAIGATVSRCLGAEYFRLPDAMDLEAVRDALQKIAGELGFTWNELLDAGVIAELDLDAFAQDWHLTTPDQWRSFIQSIGLRARHSCPGLAHHIGCDCGGQCRAFRS